MGGMRTCSSLGDHETPLAVTEAGRISRFLAELQLGASCVSQGDDIVTNSALGCWPESEGPLQCTPHECTSNFLFQGVLYAKDKN